MKRHPDLQKFSRDHHMGLVHARRLRETASGEEEGSAEDNVRAFLEFWREETSVHFRQEEEILLPVAARHGVEADGEPLSRMLVQHAGIRGLVLTLGNELDRGFPEPRTMLRLGEALEAHIRLEEREVFPYLESEMPEHALSEVSERLEASESGGD